jgi:hypothetical protein
LHSLFAYLRAINPAVVFFCHTFCNQRYIQSVVFSKPLFQSTHKQKRRLHSNRHHRAALAPEKKQLEAKLHNK